MSQRPRVGCSSDSRPGIGPNKWFLPVYTAEPGRNSCTVVNLIGNTVKKILKLNTSREVVIRVMEGIQTEVFLTETEHWTKKLFHPQRISHSRYDYITLYNGNGPGRISVTFRLRGISVRDHGRPEWGSPAGKVYALHILELCN